MKQGICGILKDGGRPPKIIIIDIPRYNMDYISYGGMEEIKNGCFFSSKYEGGMVLMNSPHVIVFANQPPDEGMMSKDRWKVKLLECL